MGDAVKQLLIEYSCNKEVTACQLVKEGSKSTDPVDPAIADFLHKHEIKGMAQSLPGFHWKATTVRPPIYILYYKGNINLLDRPTLGIVGPRRPSAYAIGVTKDLVHELRDCNVVTVSGGAQGIDRCAHLESIKADIPTLLVLGGGFRYYHNTSKWKLIERIVAAGGCVVSERKLDFEPTHYSFPQRNRIIAGFADNLFVPGAGVKSGSLITVDFARKMNRKVFSVPSTIHDSASAGSNAYLKEGKMSVVTDIQQFVRDHYAVQSDNQTRRSTKLTGLQASVLSSIAADQEVALRELITQTELSLPTLMHTVTELEHAGLICEATPGRYRCL